MLHSGFIILLRSVFWSANLNGRSDNTDVIPLNVAHILMKLRFTVTETEALALTENFRSNSPTHRRARQRARLFLPILLSLTLALFVYRFGFAPAPIGVLASAILLWYFLYPLRFDSLARRQATSQMQESSYANMFGNYEMEITQSHLFSTGPAGESKFKWNAVRRTELTDEYLFVFMSGSMGYPISIDQIGPEAARQAADEINRLRELAG